MLTLVDDDIACAEAAGEVSAGALVAVEECGCGGGGHCAPEWFRPGQTSAEPTQRPHDPTPTWIDIWRTADGRRVVFCHGALQWPGIF